MTEEWIAEQEGWSEEMNQKEKYGKTKDGKYRS